MGRLIYLAQMSAACVNELHELCQDASCEDYCHDTDDLEPLDMDEAGDNVTYVEFDTRARRREDR